MPGVPPVATPVVAPMVITEELPLLHVPPLTAVENDDEAPEQMPILPVIAAGSAFTVMTFVTPQPKDVL